MDLGCREHFMNFSPKGKGNKGKKKKKKKKRMGLYHTNSTAKETNNKTKGN